MILPFSTQLNGKPTYFVEKIHAGLLINGLWEGGFDSNFAHNNFSTDALAEKHAKIHTIREDKNNRWTPGTKIDFFINCRQPNMFRFAPVLPVVSVQKVEIIYFPLTTIPVRKVPVLKVDDEIIYDAAGINEKQMLEFANNDGFDTIENFFSYFNEDFTGKLIHWTDLKY